MVNRAELPPLKTWLATWQSFAGTRSTRPSGYARPSRFVKELGPDQVLRSDTPRSDVSEFRLSGDKKPISFLKRAFQPFHEGRRKPAGALGQILSLFNLEATWLGFAQQLPAGRVHSRPAQRVHRDRRFFAVLATEVDEGCQLLRPHLGFVELAGNAYPPSDVPSGWPSR